MPSNLVKRITLGIGTAALAVLLAACATPPANDPEALAEFNQINDPLEPTNRAIFDFNDAIDTYGLRPAAQVYRSAIPSFGRDRIADFLDNAKAPVYLGNDLLQGNFTGFIVILERFLLNSTFGVGGIMDVAAPLGIKGHKSDMGQTFGVWGFSDGPYLVLPLFGPSSVRDAIGVGVEAYGEPVDYYLQNNYLKWVSAVRMGATALSQREAYLDLLDDVKRTSLDYYSALRSLYRQRRTAQINDAKAVASGSPSDAGKPTDQTKPK